MEQKRSMETTGIATEARRQDCLIYLREGNDITKHPAFCETCAHASGYCGMCSGLHFVLMNAAESVKAEEARLNCNYPLEKACNCGSGMPNDMCSYNTEYCG